MVSAPDCQQRHAVGLTATAKDEKPRSQPDLPNSARCLNACLCVAWHLRSLFRPCTSMCTVTANQRMLSPGGHVRLCESRLPKRTLSVMQNPPVPRSTILEAARKGGAARSSQGVLHTP